jgi:hypothetical protein
MFWELGKSVAAIIGGCELVGSVATKESGEPGSSSDGLRLADGTRRDELKDWAISDLDNSALIRWENRCVTTAYLRRW